MQNKLKQLFMIFQLYMKRKVFYKQLKTFTALSLFMKKAKS